MMRKILLVLTVLATSAVFAQKGNTSSAGISWKNYLGAKYSGDYETAVEELKDAKEYIDKSFVHGDTKDDPKTLKYYGFVYMEIPQMAQLTGDEELSAVDPETAITDGIAALKRSKELDTKKKYVDDIDDYCDIYRGQLSQVGEAMWKEEKWEECAMAFIGAAMYGDIMGFVDSSLYFYGALAASYDENWELAAEGFEKTVEIGYEPAESTVRLSQAYQKLERFDEAEAMLKKQSERYPGKIEIITELINFYIDMDRKEDAVTFLKEAIALDEGNTVYIMKLGEVYEDLGDYENAQASYEKVLATDPNNTNALDAMGTLFFNMGADVYNEANDLEYNDPKRDGLVADSQVLFEKSVPYFEKAVATEDGANNIAIWDRLAKAYGRTGDKEKFQEAKAKIKELQGS